MAAIVRDWDVNPSFRAQQSARTKKFNEWVYQKHLQNGGGDFDGFTCEGDFSMLVALCPVSGKYDFGGNFKSKVPNGYIKIASGQFYVFAKIDDKCRILEETLKESLLEQFTIERHSAPAESDQNDSVLKTINNMPAKYLLEIPCIVEMLA